MVEYFVRSLKKKKIVRMDGWFVESIGNYFFFFFTSKGTINMNPFDGIRIDERFRKFDGSNERYIYVYVM